MENSRVLSIQWINCYQNPIYFLQFTENLHVLLLLPFYLVDKYEASRFMYLGFFLKLLFKVKKRQSLLASRELEIKNDKMVFYKEFSWGIFCQCIHLSLSLAQLLWSFTSEMVQAQRVLICKLGWLLVLKNMDACKDTVNNEGTR